MQRLEDSVAKRRVGLTRHQLRIANYRYVKRLMENEKKKKTTINSDWNKVENKAAEAIVRSMCYPTQEVYITIYS